MDRKDLSKESIREKLKRISKPDTTWIKKAKKRAGINEKEWIEKSNYVDSFESCNSNEISGETHTCPFREAINDYEFECNCCEVCTNDCSMSIKILTR